MYWSLLTTFLNNKKIPVIPPLFHNNFITNLTPFLAKQRSLIKNYNKFPLTLHFVTDKRLLNENNKII